jgi:uncharacterized protein (DUF2236 family)
MKSYLGWKIDFANPPGAPAFTGPDSVQWRVFKNPIALGIGGVCAVLMEFADPRIRSGVWDHSTFKTDPIGRSTRTGMAAMIGCYGPRDAARRVIQGVTNMHARVGGATPQGGAYQALDVDLLDWVSATAGYGFLTAYDRFCGPVSATDKARYYTEGQAVAALYGVKTGLSSDADFAAMTDRLLPGFEPHPIIAEFLDIIQKRDSLPGVPGPLRRALAKAAVAITPASIRTAIGLDGATWRLGPIEDAALKSLGAFADRIAPPGAPPVAACKRLGLPGDFLYRSQAAQARILAAWRGTAEPQMAG